MSRFNGNPAGGPQTGKGVAVGAVTAGSNTNVSVTFPTAYANAPVVLVIPFNGRLTAGMSSVSTTGFTVNFANWSGSNATATTFDWVAYPA